MIESNLNKLIWAVGGVIVTILLVLGAKTTMPEALNLIGNTIIANIDNEASRVGDTRVEYYERGYLDYIFDGTQATVTGFKFGQDRKNLVIPKYIVKNDVKYTVTVIAHDAFVGKGLTSLDLPNSISIINYGAFYNNQISQIVLPNSIQVIGDSAFEYNKQVSHKITIPSSVKSVGADTFAYTDLYDVSLSRVTVYDIRDGFNSFERGYTVTTGENGVRVFHSVGIPNMHYYD